MQTSNCKAQEAAPASRHTVPGGARREDRAKGSTASIDKEYCRHTACPTCRGHAAPRIQRAGKRTADGRSAHTWQWRR
eukprot:14594891-Alexandrium_andersonii.AAC.1